MQDFIGTSWHDKLMTIGYGLSHIPLLWASMAFSLLPPQESDNPSTPSPSPPFVLPLASSLLPLFLGSLCCATVNRLADDPQPWVKSLLALASFLAMVATSLAGSFENCPATIYLLFIAAISLYTLLVIVSSFLPFCRCANRSSHIVDIHYMTYSPLLATSIALLYPIRTYFSALHWIFIATALSGMALAGAYSSVFTDKHLFYMGTLMTSSSVYFLLTFGLPSTSSPSPPSPIHQKAYFFMISAFTTSIAPVIDMHRAARNIIKPETATPQTTLPTTLPTTPHHA